MTRREAIEKATIRIVMTLIPKGHPIYLSSRIIEDLKMLSDDATAMALDLEREFKTKVPRKEWREVYTLLDVVNLIDKHINSN